jgi:MoaA/NifB/PqqE/SkfB family radical SAM enzyme
MCEKSIPLGINELQLLRFVGVGRGSHLKEMALTPEHLSVFFEKVKEARKKYQKTVLEIRPHGNFGPGLSSLGKMLAKENKYCPAGIGAVAIDPQNNVYACPFLMQPENKIGVLKEGNIIIEKNLLNGRRDTCISHLF